MVPTLTLTSMFDEPSSGSNTTMYLAPGEPPSAISGCSFSSEASIATLSRTLRRVHQHFVGVDVELLLHLALHVHVAGRAKNVRQTGAAHFGFDQLRGQRDTREQPGKLARDAAESPLFAEDVLLNGDDRRVNGAGRMRQLGSRFVVGHGVVTLVGSFKTAWEKGAVPGSF